MVSNEERGGVLMIGVNSLRRVAILSFVLTSIVYSQESDSLLIRNYKEYKNGVFNDSALSILYRHGLISKEMYLSKKYGKMPLDSIRFADLRAKLKYKFVLDFLERTQAARSLLSLEDFNQATQFSELFRVSDVKPKDAVESFNYYLPYDLYQVWSFDDKHKLFLLAASYPLYGLERLFLFDDGKNNHELLDTLCFNPKNNAEFDFLQLNGHSIIRLRQSVHGTGYLDEQEVLIGIIDKKFHNLFSTDLLQANDWTMSPTDTSNNFDRWTAKITFVDNNGDSLPRIRKEVSEDVISMDGVKNFDFAAGHVTKHIRSWVEVYVWDNETKAYALDKKVNDAAVKVKR